ncbi:hypothetical protein Btru_019492 [Bulinus truncatus]|nr:hypothetical protein Btru_019492 [Bulinus truncatus]
MNSFCLTVFGVLVFIVRQQTSTARHHGNDVTDRQHECTYDPVSGQDLCRSVDEVNSSHDSCDYSHCYTEWTHLLADIHRNVSEGRTILTHVDQWSEVCSDRAMGQTEACATLVAGQCTSSHQNRTFIVLGYFCDEYGQKVYLNLNNTRCNPGGNDHSQCKQQALTGTAMVNSDSTLTQVCLFADLYGECYRDQLLSHCGQDYLDFYNLLQVADDWSVCDQEKK